MTKNNEKPLWKNTLNNIWANTKEVLPDFINGLSNINNNNVYSNNMNFSNYSPKVYPIQNDSYQLPNQNFSTFNMKSTKDLIKESTNNIENVLKQKNISYDYIPEIEKRNKFAIHSLFDDIEDLSAKKSYLPEIPILKSAEKSNSIENERNQIREDASNIIIMLNLSKNALDKQWKNVSKKDENFDEKFDTYTKKKYEIDNLSNKVMNLFYIADDINKNTDEKVQKLRDELGLMRFRPKLQRKIEIQEQKWIMPCNGVITSKYGKRKPPVPGASEFHNGWDIGVSEGTPIKAIADGKIIAVGKARGYGNWVVIDHGIINGVNVTSEYGHISSWNVKYGQIVKQGDVIAKSGNTGYSSGPHLHLTIREGTINRTAVDPKKYIKNYF